MNDTTKTGTAMSTTPLRQVQDVKTLLFNENAKAQLQMVAAKHLDPERMMRVVANAIRTTPKLQQCEPMSFLGALMHCASLGLEPNTPLGHAYLIPFENKRKNVTEVQVVIGYKGLIDLARRTGQLASIHGDVVYSDDKLFSHEYGSNQHLRHIPGPRKGKIVAFYCYVELDMGHGTTAKGHRVMTLEEVIAHRNQYSQGWKTAVRFNKTKDSPWSEENPAFEAMGIKTVIRRMASRGELPMSVEFIQAMDTDEERVDYRKMAFDFEAGPELLPDDEGESQDGEPAAIEGKAEAVKDAEKPKEESKPKADQAAKVEDKPKEDPKPKAEPLRQLSPEEQEAEAERKANMVSTIMNDLMEAGRGHTKDALALYEDALERMALDDPQSLEVIMNRAKAIEDGEYDD